MKHNLKSIFALIIFALLTSTTVQAGSEEKMIIALKTDDSGLVESDISDLAIGESQTIETDSGKVIDILRTADGAEVYIDGELMEMDFSGEGLHEEHEIHEMQQHVEIICDDDEECDKNVFIMASDDSDAEWVTEDGENIIIHKEIEISCSADEESTECSDKMVWISEGDDVGLEELHEMHTSGDGEGHKVIIIKKHVDSKD